MLAPLGKWLLLFGLFCVAVGALLLFGERVGLFRLPGDFTWKWKHTTLHFPLATSLVVSVVLTVVVNLLLSRR